MSYSLDITIAIPVKNEEKNLQKCLAAIGNDFAKHVVIIDSGSTDSTLQIAEQWGADIISFIWDGKFPKKRNWFLRNHTPATTWVLFIDADEYINDAFKKEVRRKLISDDKAGYWLSYSVYFMGKRLKGGYPLRKLALFKTGVGEYEQIDENNWSKLDMEVHEHPVLTGEIGTIYSKIDHQDFRGVSHYVMKHDEYASWEAARFLKLNSGQNLKTWTIKQQVKYYFMKSVFIGPVYFFGSFFLLGGFRDGARGLVFAIFKMAYFTEVYCKIKEAEPLLPVKENYSSIPVLKQHG
jgi:glycosyltransferase involved in cell wall biosynthesis